MSGSPRRRKVREAGAASASPALLRTRDGGDTNSSVPCTNCEGEGKTRDGKRCPVCAGTGSMPATKSKEAESALAKAVSGEDIADVACTTCDGHGVSDGIACTDCNGTGQGGTTAASGDEDDDEFAEPGADPDPGQASLPEVTGAGGKGKQRVPEAAGSNVGKQRFDEVQGTGGQGLTETAKESESLLERLEALEREVNVFSKLREARAGPMSPTYSTPARVQTSDGREGYRVVLIREGKGNHEDDQYYTADAIKDLVESGTAEGMQAFGNHPTLDEEDERPERDVKQLVGTYHDVKFVQESGQVARAEAVFVPLTYDESHPHYGWVVTLAEAASRSSSPQPVCGISLYGFSVGDDADRPDGSYGRMVEMIRPSSGDIVTNAGAGGGFIRQLMESARALRNRSRKEPHPMLTMAYQTAVREAVKRVREADSDEDRTAAIEALEALGQEKIDNAPDSVEALTEAAPQLVAKIRESVTADASKTEEELRAQLREVQGTLSKIADVSNISAVLRECEVTDEKERRYFISQCQTRGLREAEDIRDLVNTEREYRKDQEESTLARLRESLNLEEMEVEGVYARVPAPQPDAVMSILRESGIPLKEAS